MNQVAELRNNPFLLLVVKDGQRDNFLSATFIETIQTQLEDMSLQFAKKYFSVVYVDEIQAACKNVLGIANLGLMILSNQNQDKAIFILKEKGIIGCFRKGWMEIMDLEKINPVNDPFLYKKFSLEVNENTNNLLVLEDLQKKFSESNLLQELNTKLLSQYYPHFFQSKDEDMVKKAGVELSHYICTIIIKAFIDIENTSLGALNASELLTFIDNIFTYPEKELSKMITSNENVLNLVKNLSIDLRKIFQTQLDNFVLIHNEFPLHEMYNIIEANKGYSKEQFACIISEHQALDINREAISNIADKLSEKEWKELNLPDRGMFSLYDGNHIYKKNGTNWFRFLFV